MPADLVTELVPVLGRRLEQEFNVFDVMHHGVHEKQISNVFRWLLDDEATHQLGDRFVRIFVDEINAARPGQTPVPHGKYTVRQEVNTAPSGVLGDIADLVLTSSTAAIVVENYFTSDGHGHNYDGYLAYGMRDSRYGVVALLCLDQDFALQTLGWENAPVLTYGRLVDRLHTELQSDDHYREANADAYAFIEQMHRKFVKGRGRMQDHDALGFVVALCATGEAARYKTRRQDVAAEQFANDLAVQARERFVEGRELLRRTKKRVLAFGAGPLRSQLDASHQDGFIREVSATLQGIYEWSVNFYVAGVEGESIQIKFGPSAWYANEQDRRWRQRVDVESVDYSHLFVTNAKTMQLVQTSVTIQEVLDGLEPTDQRLHDEIVHLLGTN